MAIDNPQAVKFVNESVRPKAERLRAIKAEIDAMMVDWFGGVNAMFPNDSTPVEDGREAEGVSRLTGEDVVGFIVVAQAVQTALNQAGVADRIAKPCVRPLRVD